MTPLFQNMKALEAEIDELDRVGALRNLSDAENARFAALLAEIGKADAAYFGALEEAREAWGRLDIPQDIKGAAEENANDTPGTDKDELHWFDIAARSVADVEAAR
jgi:hypothetical protein